MTKISVPFLTAKLYQNKMQLTRVFQHYKVWRPVDLTDNSKTVLEKIKKHYELNN